MDITVKVSIIIKNDENKILLLKEKSDKHDKPLWNIVKGTYGDNGDENIYDAAKRECLEETSTEVELLSALGAYISKKDEKIRIQFNFEAKIVKGTPQVAEQEDQYERNEAIYEVRWFTFNEVQKLKANDFISNRIYQTIQNYMKGDRYPLEIYKQIGM